MLRSATFGPARCRLIPAALAILIVFPALGVAKQSRMAKQEAKYESETDPVHKAKVLAKLGVLEMKEALRQLKAGHEQKSLSIVSRYRDEVHATTSALIESGRDPVKHPAGFKELQIGLRKCIDRLDDMILAMPVETRPWFRAVRSDLQESQNRLLDALFPSVKKVAAWANQRPVR